jgi:hypothetical protein
MEADNTYRLVAQELLDLQTACRCRAGKRAQHQGEQNSQN